MTTSAKSKKMADTNTVSKVKQLFSSFLSSFGKSFKDSTSYRLEPDGNIQSKISEGHTEGKIDVADVRNRSLFYERVGSFTTFTWFAKPLDLCPLVCAKYGWTNVDLDMLQCVGCQVFLCGQLPKSVETQHYRDCCNKLRNCLIESHEKLCKWSTNPCPDVFLHVPYHDREDILNGFWSRALSLRSCTLPSLDYKSFTEKNVSEEMAHDLVTRIQKIERIQEDISTAVGVLALSGWFLCKTDSGILQCSYCRRKVGLWNFKRDNNNSDSEIHPDSMYKSFCMQICTEISNQTHTDNKENNDQKIDSANSHSPDADGDTLKFTEGNIEQKCKLGISHLKDKESERESYNLDGKQCKAEYFHLKEKESETEEKQSETDSCQLEETETKSCHMQKKQSETESYKLKEKETETEGCDMKETESERESCELREKENETESCHVTEKESETEGCDMTETEMIHSSNSDHQKGINSVSANPTRAICVNGDRKRPADHGDSNNDPQKKRPRLEKQKFDPLAEHRFWCPWMQTVSALSVQKLQTSMGTSPSSSPVKSATPAKGQLDASVVHMSTTSGEAGDETIPAWLLIAKILRSQDQDQDEFCKQFQMRPQIERLQQIRRVLRKCTSLTTPGVLKTA